MMYLPSLLSLPSATILLLYASSASADSKRDVPIHYKYFPEEEIHMRRNLDIQKRLQHEKPIGIKKMSMDEGEMFMLDNWIFASDAKSQLAERSKDYKDFGNGTVQAQSPLRPLTEDDLLSRLHIRDLLLKRQFSCLAGTTNCTTIGAPDVCCGTGSYCYNTNINTEAGSIGCCALGQTCSGPVSCDIARGYSACPGSPNGGCCLPNFKCQGIGCVYQGTSTTFVQPPTSSARPPSSSAPPPPSSTAVTVVSTTPPTSAKPTPIPSSTSTYTCPTGSFSCPASLNGGCCENGLTCGTGITCGSGTQTPSAPMRPTNSAIITTSASPSPASPNDVCPTGFYVCSAYYPSGCCRVGRDCSTTGTCVLPTETLLSTNGVVIVAPSGASVATTAKPQGGSCPSAWYSCAASRGGNCCMNGYECGEHCTPTASGQTGVMDKVAPSKASFVSVMGVWVMISVAVAVVVGMIAL